MAASTRMDSRLAHTPANLQDLLLEAQEIARMGSWSWDPETGSLFLSSPILEVLGLPAEDMTTMGEFMSRVHPEDRDRVARLRAEALDSGASGYTAEYRVLGAEGCLHVVARGRIERDGRGKPLRVYGSIQDITESKRMEEALEQERTYLAGLFENSPDAVVVTDAQGKIQRTNRAFSALFGYGADEAEGRQIDELVVPKRLLAEGLGYTGSLGRGIRLDFESVRRRKDGTEFPCRGVGVPVALNGGQVGVYCIYRDLSREKAAQEQLRQALETMERAWEQTVEALASTSEVKDPYTSGHQRRVAALAAAIAREMGMPGAFVSGVEKAALVHDLGKIEVPAELLSRPGRLSPFEFRLVQMHAEAGYRILSKIHLPWPLAEIVYQHHERLDGSGYPRGLKGTEILPEARVIAVADIVEAVCSHRPYRPARSLEEALAAVREGSGRTLDEKAVKACLRLFEERGFAFPE
jgi:PAS domain S-box-containing protein/putative nucleotidyltransferase with HDIG domain